MPVRFSAIQLGGQLGLESLFADSEFEVPLQLPLTDAAQCFFALSKLRTWKISWTMLLLFSGDSAISSLAAATMIQKAGWLRKSTGLTRRACFQLSHTLFYTVKAGESLLAVGADVGMHDLELGGDVLDGGGEADDGITGFVIAATEAHGPHRSNAYGCAGYCGDDLYHSGSRAATPKRRR